MSGSSQHNDIQHNDFDHNDIQHNGSEHNGIQHNNKYNATLSTLTFSKMVEWFYAVCVIMLNITYKFFMLSVIMLSVVPLAAQ
jgi:hypothetical protein